MDQLPHRIKPRVIITHNLGGDNCFRGGRWNIVKSSTDIHPACAICVSLKHESVNFYELVAKSYERVESNLVTQTPGCVRRESRETKTAPRERPSKPRLGWLNSVATKKTANANSAFRTRVSFFTWYCSPYVGVFFRDNGWKITSERWCHHRCLHTCRANQPCIIHCGYHNARDCWNS
ncbi:MAG: hypothetical protein J07HQX50_01724 [Haloquadratum sp. J07HQX50]|nr:MAG: hypothetical protein J07HQX50_01724 [Haloquadratum sp. J07HQX50]